MRNVADMSRVGEHELFDLCHTVVHVGPNGTVADVFEDAALTEAWRSRAAARDLAELPVAELVALRELVTVTFDAADRGAALPGVVRGKLNYLAAGAPVTFSLSERGELQLLEAAPEPQARLARLALELYARAQTVAAVRRCHASGCGRFFEPRRADQEWCSTRCGTRVRAARFRAARRSGDAAQGVAATRSG